MRIDSHQHFWIYDPGQYGWMDERMGVLKRDRLPADLSPLLRSIGFAGSIAVQARQTPEETRWLLQLADENPFILGVVGWVDLRSPELGAQLERFAPHPKLKGVRHVVQDEPDDEFMLRPEFLRGIGLLREFGLTYDLLTLSKHLRVAAALADRFPDQPFVLDHLGKPFIARGELSPWREDLRELAKRPNVCCKLSGMVTEAAWGQWRPADFRAYLDVAMEAFGAGRLMIGSDWPVCTLSGEYEPVMRLVMDYVSALEADEREGILGGNCGTFYGVTGGSQ